LRIFDSIKEGITNHFERRKQDREMMERLQKEADMQRRIVFQQEYRKNALEVATAQAKKDAASKSGLQKLRAMNRVRNLEKSNPEDTGNFFQKLSVYTQKNIARREENLEKTEMMRSEAQKIKNNNLQKKPFQRNGTMNKVKPLAFSTRR